VPTELYEDFGFSRWGTRSKKATGCESETSNLSGWKPVILFSEIGTSRTRALPGPKNSF
jgi:hypothetical protein